jgi:hypothetical protein
MINFLAHTIPAAVRSALASIAAEDRPGFDERSPLS